MGSLQREVAQQIGVTECTVINWESNETQPTIRHIPRIILFLGYNPFPEPTTLREKLKQARKVLGFSQREMAQRLDVDPTTIGFWERGERTPAKKLRTKLEHDLD